MKNPIRNNLVIELHVPDFAPIKEFYPKLGFEILREDPIEDGSAKYLILIRKSELGDTMLHFWGGDEGVYNQSYYKQFPKDTVRGYAAELTIPVVDVDAAYTEAQERIPDYIVKPLKETITNQQSWRDFRLADPYGFYIRITELCDWNQPEVG